ncbi:hypothetical protein AQ505_19725 [Pedobacter sp. PACM 27299]|uniref:hypothetical protein n=1 Tax=Pedobacter sp. PACM 27299 TaxID=1727164 RepID=UPI000706A912|nr:hypothetical protein [Pedobacter sp. PACM 27299]ALL07524.1 hypothetical protein AQ505_19725 [Pedobacter sp. PACM 27299]
MEEKITRSKASWPIKAVIIIILFIGAGYWALESGRFDAEANNLISIDTLKKKAMVSSPDDHREFNYTPEKPVNGEYKGVVEVGASGFNSFIVNIDKEKRWEIVSKDFGKSFVYEGMASTTDIRMGLKDYIGGMFDKGLKSKNIHFVISSGAQKEPKTAVISSELKNMGYVVNLVTPEEEGKLALKCVLPDSYANTSFVVDIGSGNTKICWKDNTVHFEEAPGAKYYEKDITDQVVYDKVKQAAQKIPDARRKVCFIIGGVPFELANQGRKGQERYTVLKDPGKYKTDKIKIKSGVNIYQGIKDATNCNTFVFDWDSNFTIGFLLSI